MFVLLASLPFVDVIWPITLFCVLCAVAILAVIQIFFIYLVYTFSRATLTRLAVPTKKHNRELTLATKDHSWAKQMGFRFLGFYKLGPKFKAFVCLWADEDNSRFLTAFSSRQKYAFDILTSFEGGGMLATGLGSFDLLFPVPTGVYAQAFTRFSIDKRWQRHLESEVYLGQAIDTGQAAIPEEFERVYLRNIHRQMQHVRSIPFWYIKIGYWLLVRRTRLANKTIEQQYNAGLIELSDGDLNAYET